MKPRPLTVRDYVRALSRAMTPVANRLTKALTVSEYMSGQDQHHPDAHAFGGNPRITQHHHRRPWHQWPLENTWGYDSESERFERELWMEQIFYNDADFGVTYGESTWDGRWNNDEAWRR
jgi:hypothetical protein